MKHLFILIVALYLFIPSYLYGQNPKPSAKEIYELNEKCGSMRRHFSKKNMEMAFKHLKMVQCLQATQIIITSN